MPTGVLLGLFPVWGHARIVRLLIVQAPAVGMGLEVEVTLANSSRKHGGVVRYVGPTDFGGTGVWIGCVQRRIDVIRRIHSRVNCVPEHIVVEGIPVLVGGAIPPVPAVTASTLISARLKHVQEHSSPVNIYNMKLQIVYAVPAQYSRCW